MDILIKGMEMPTKVNHPLFIRISSDGRIAKGDFLKDGFFETEAKAVALSSHGRLGDLDALKNSVADMRMEKPLRNGAKQVIEIGELFGRIIDDAPTIVEASE